MIIDASTHAAVAKAAGVNFTPFPSGDHLFTRVVVGNEISVKADPSIVTARVLPTRLPAVGEQPGYRVYASHSYGGRFLRSVR